MYYNIFVVMLLYLLVVLQSHVIYKTHKTTTHV